MANGLLKDHAMNQTAWKFLAAIVPTVAVLLAGCGRVKTEPPPQAPEVVVMAIQPQQVSLTTELPGRTIAYRVAEIRPQVSGLIQKRLFTEGARVKAGELLYEIDPAPYAASYNNAAAAVVSANQAVKKAQATLDSSVAAIQRHKAVLKLAKVNRERYEKLVAKHAVSTMDYDQSGVDVEAAEAALRVAEAQVEGDRQSVEVAKASVQQAEAALDAAKISLDYTKITASISGRIGRSNVTDGAIATAYQATPLATIQQMDPMYVDVPQSTVQLLQLKTNLERGHLKASGTDKVKLILENGTVYPLAGSLQFTDATVDQTTGSVVLRIVVPNSDGTLLPGMYVRAIIEEGVHDGAILVPQQAVSRDAKGNPFVLIVDSKDVVQQRELVTDRSIGDKWLVSSGLAAGDRVIIEGAQKVMPGIGVTVAQTPIGDNTATSSKSSVQTTTR
jgi:membrane fusion protein (multidrug efflux system)